MRQQKKLYQSSDTPQLYNLLPLALTLSRRFKEISISQDRYNDRPSQRLGPIYLESAQNSSED